MSSQQPENGPKLVLTVPLAVINGIILLIIAAVLLSVVSFFSGSDCIGQLLAALTPYPWAFLYGAYFILPLFLGGELLWILRHKLGLIGESSEDFFDKKGNTLGEFAIFSLFSGFPEEVLFRGALLPFCGIWISSVLFGLVHCSGKRSWPYVIETFLMGVALSYMFVLSGNLWVPIVVHIGNNFLSFTVAKRLRSVFGVRS